MAGEQKLQTKILGWLKDNGFWAVKITVASKAGTPDILACSPKGRLVGIEVKYGPNKPSKLQEYHVAQINELGGIAFVTWDLETVIYKLSGELSEKEEPKSNSKSGSFLL